MARIRIDGEKLVIELEGLFEKVMTLKRRLEIPLNCIEKVAYVKDLDETERKRVLPMIRLWGYSLHPTHYGVFITRVGRGFFVSKDLEKSVVIYLSGCLPYKIVVIEASDPETVESLKKRLMNKTF
jgi:hypothetical protein